MAKKNAVNSTTELQEAPVLQKVYKVTPEAAEDLRSANRRLVQLRSNIGDTFIVIKTMEVNLKMASDDIAKLTADFNKNAQEFENALKVAASKLGINLDTEKDWKFDLESGTFIKGAQ